MAWTDSRVFEAFMEAAIENSPQITGPATWTGVDGDSLKAALYNNSITPDRDAAVASIGYNTGTWANTNEVSDGTNWDAGGEPLTSVTVESAGTGILMVDAVDTPQGGASTTLSNVHGCLVYDDDIVTTPVTDLGISFHYFGGTQSVTNGNFTIVWHADGLWRVTV